MNFNDETNKSINKISHFYIDESSLEIEGKEHIIVCAITSHSPSESVLRMVEIKKELGFHALDEVKINTKGLTKDKKIKLTDGVLDIIGDCTAFICIIEGKDKQKSAEKITLQLFDYCNQNNIEGYYLFFDKDLVHKPTEFEQFVRNNLNYGAVCLGIQHFNSTSEQLIQCCDVFLGLFRLSLEIEFGKREIKRNVYTPSIDAEDEWSLSDYVILFSRGQIWGKVENRKSHYDFDGENVEFTNPYHCSFGLGIRIESTISEQAKKVIEDNLATAYLGCLS
jgi:hypothetical protein